jgi:phosphatidylglycerophosphatase A
MAVFVRRIILVFANGFGLGLSPFAPGTVGTLLGVAIVVGIGFAELNWMWQAGVAAVLAVCAIPICEVGEMHYKTKDDHRIVADEYLTFPLCVIGIPWMAHPWFLAVAFVINRVMDIIKPPPARQIQELHGGLGITLDDMISSLYALAVNHLIFRLVVK